MDQRPDHTGAAVEAALIPRDDALRHELDRIQHAREQLESERMQDQRPAKHCKFHARGFCRAGDACKFRHENNMNGKLSEKRRYQPCSYFLLGKCQRGRRCAYSHASATPDARRDGENVSKPRCIYYARGECGADMGLKCNFCHDGRPPSQIPCTFFAEGRCKKGRDCRYSHTAPVESVPPRQMVKPVEHTRQILGASISFGKGAAVKDIRLPSDFSTARIVMLQDDCTIMDVFKFLCSLGFEVPITAIRLGRHRNAMSALVRVQDPNFATALCNKIKVAKVVSNNNVYQKVYAMICDAPKRGPTTHIVPRTFQSKVTCGWITADKDNAAAAREIAHVQRLLEGIGPLATQLTRVGDETKFTRPVFEGSLLNSVFAGARFESAQDATRAVAKLHHFRLPFGNRPVLDVSQRFSACYKIPNWLVKRLPNKLWKDVLNSRTGRMPPSVNLIHSRGSSTATLRLESHDPESLHLAEHSLNISFRGTLATDADGKTPLWTPFFNAEGGRRAYFSQAMQRWKVELRYFPVKKTFTIHGEHDSVCLAHQDILNGFLKHRTQQVTDVRKCRTIANENHRLSCVVCCSEEGEAVVIGCGHAYCTICFVDFCKQGVSGHMGWDFQCYGRLDGGAECGRTFSMEELKFLLSDGFLEQLMLSSARTYMMRHPEEFRYCPTPDCECVYRVTLPEKPGSFTCPGCEKKTCTACNAEPHAGKCGEDRYIESGDKRRDLDVMKELGYKKCPKCGTFIEKTDGCVHVECHCGAHVCFACLAAFKSANACTFHMVDAHENWADEGHEVEDEEDDGEN